jgi:hypothetical protein
MNLVINIRFEFVTAVTMGGIIIVYYYYLIEEQMGFYPVAVVIQ